MPKLEEELSLKEIILKIQDWYFFVKSKLKSLAIIACIGMLFGLLYSLFSEPKYKANLTFALEDKTANGASLGSIASQFGLNLGGSEGGAFAGDNLIELLKSRFIIEKTLLTQVEINGKNELLINRYIKFNKLDEKWESNSDLNNLKFITSNRIQFSLQHDSILGVVYKNVVNNMLVVNKLDKKLSIVKVTITSKDELFAKYFAENIVKNVTDFYIETKTSKSRSNISLLEFRVDSVRKELDAAMYGRAQFSDQNLGLVRQSAAVPRVKQELRVQMLSTMYTELIKNLEFSKLALMREEPLIQIIDSPILPLEKKQLGKLKGMVIGIILFSLIGLIYLIIKKLINNVLYN